MKNWFYLGTYTGGESKGIYWGQFDLETGRLLLAEETLYTENPSYLCFHPTGDYLYCVNEVMEFAKQEVGSVTALARDGRTGSLRPLNQESTLGKQPCHLSLDHLSRYILIANYGGGNVSVLPILADGRLGPAVGYAQHEGTGPHRERQEAPHPHSIVGNDRDLVYVSDLGIDKVVIYKLAADGGLTPAGFGLGNPGSGPRHLVLSPNGKYAYVVNELDSSLAIYQHGVEPGSLDKIGVEATLPAGFTGINTCADLKVHPNGRFLYVSNRGHDSLACFCLEEDGKRLVSAGHTPVEGNSPRSFAITSCGNYLVVVNQLSCTIVPFRIDQRTGTLERVGDMLTVPDPTCILFWEEKCN